MSKRPCEGTHKLVAIIGQLTFSILSTPNLGMGVLSTRLEKGMFLSDVSSKASLQVSLGVSGLKGPVLV